MTGVLAIETATDACSLAIYCDGETQERHTVAPRQHSTLLFTLLEELIPGGDLRGRGIEVIAYGSGPGSFTGLRIAASVAQGLAYSCRLPAVPVPTLAVLAQTGHSSGVLDASHSAFCLLDARANEVYSAVYTFEDGLAQKQEGPRACAPSELSLIERGTIMAIGSGCRYLEQFPRAIRDSLSATVPDLLPRARDMIPFAQLMHERGEIQDPADIQPVYVRDEINWKKLSEQGK